MPGDLIADPDPNSTETVDVSDLDWVFVECIAADGGSGGDFGGGSGGSGGSIAGYVDVSGINEMEAGSPDVGNSPYANGGTGAGGMAGILGDGDWVVASGGGGQGGSDNSQGAGGGNEGFGDPDGESIASDYPDDIGTLGGTGGSEGGFTVPGNGGPGSTYNNSSVFILETSPEDSSVGARIYDDEPDPAEFEVSIDDTNSPVFEGETVEVDYTVENTGDLEGDSQTVELVVEGEGVVDSESTGDLSGGESVSGTLEWETSDDDEGNYEITVSTEDDQDTETITVEEFPPPIDEEEFEATGDVQEYVVPDNADYLEIECVGASGGSAGGSGGKTTGSPGDGGKVVVEYQDDLSGTLDVYVGERGGDGEGLDSGDGGWPDGGEGSRGSSRASSGGGGGSSRVEHNGNIIALAGGGGGESAANSSDPGGSQGAGSSGSGGADEGGDGSDQSRGGGFQRPEVDADGGTGGSQSSGGSGGSANALATGEEWDSDGRSGGHLSGANGTSVGDDLDFSAASGGGGGGYYGGGSGGAAGGLNNAEDELVAAAGGSGGGSNYTSSDVEEIENERGTNSGDGIVKITAYQSLSDFDFFVNNDQVIEITIDGDEVTEVTVDGEPI